MPLEVCAPLWAMLSGGFAAALRAITQAVSWEGLPWPTRMAARVRVLQGRRQSSQGNKWPRLQV